MSYAVEHSGAVADIQAAGAAVSFTLTTGTYTPATDTFGTASTTTVSGYAITVSGDPERFRSLGLVQSGSITLLFAPTTYGGLPLPGYSVTWGGAVYTVRDCEPLAPDGTAIIARVICGK